MSIAESNVVDAIGVDLSSGDLVLTISDHLGWGEDDFDEHIFLLQEKLNTYFRFVESGEIFSTYPDAEGRSILIDVVCKHSMSARALFFFDQFVKISEEARIRLRRREL